MDSLRAHVAIALLEAGFASEEVVDCPEFPGGATDGRCLFLLGTVGNPTVEQARSWLEHWQEALPSDIHLLVLVLPFDHQVPEDVQKLVLSSRTGGVLKRGCALAALDPVRGELVARLDNLETGGMLQAVNLALRRYDPARPIDPEDLRRREEAARAEVRAAAERLYRVQPRATYALIALCVAVFALMTASGGSYLSWNLLRFGANYEPLDKQGQIWRWGSAMFIHIGWLHLLVNMYALYSVGVWLERFLGNWRYMAIYAVSGLTGGLFTTYFGRGALSAGASGAIFGLFGAGLVLYRTSRGELPERIRRSLLSGFGPTIFYNLAIGFTASFIDNSAHLGGLLGGGLCMVLLRTERSWMKPLYAVFALLPVGCLFYALGQAVRYPTAEQFPTLAVDSVGGHYQMDLPAFVRPIEVDKTTAYVGLDRQWLLRELASPVEVDMAHPEVEAALLKLLVPPKGLRESHEKKTIGGRTWLLVRAQADNGNLICLGVAFQGQLGLLPSVTVAGKNQEGAQAAFERELATIRIK